jgi:NADPH:quinone reductase-like Zn-dependent oxidoreductase
MKAIVFETYGSPDILTLKEIAKPVPGDDEILIKVHAAAANPLDWHRYRADPFFVRFSDGLLKPKNTGLGADIAGTVEAIGRNVTQFKPGDAVFGDIGSRGFAEYALAKASQIAHKPANISFAEAAAVPVAALTALQGLRNHGNIQAGQNVLINGASGGIGTYAVQLAKHFGAQVTGVCSGRNADMVRRLGADHVIDYTKADFADGSQQYDLILDNVGNRTVADYKRATTPNGTTVVAGFTTIPRMFSVMTRGGWITRRSERKIGAMMARIVQDDLTLLAELLANGTVKSVVDQCYPLDETADALRYLETGRVKGKVVVSILPDAPQ